MAENIEMSSFSRRRHKRSRRQTEERIDVSSNNHETEDSQKESSARNRIVNEYNFFVADGSPMKHCQGNENLNASPKTASDMINAELANIENPITETIIAMPTYNDIDYFVHPQHQSGADENVKLFSKMRQRLRQEEFCSDWLDDSGNPIFHLTPLSPKTRLESMLRNNSLQVTYVPPYVNDADSMVELNKNHKITLMDIEFGHFKFKHHSLFSLEHILSECLKECYMEYVNRNAKDILHQLNDELRINRNAREKVKKELLKLHRSKQEIHLDSTVIKYNKKIEELKETYYNESILELKNTENIMLLWKDIKTVRKEMSTVNTSLVLEVIKEDVSLEEFSETWNERFNLEFIDALHNIEYKYAKQCLDYKNRKLNKENIKGKSGCRKVTKPRLNFNEDEVKKKIEQTLNDLVPRKSKTILKLHFDDHLMTKISTESPETNRRKRMEEMIYFFRVYVDEYIVCETNHFTLNNDFSTNLSESLSVQILPSNKSMNIVLIENEAVISKVVINIDGIGKYLIKQLIFNVEGKVDEMDYCTGSGNTLQDISKYLDINLRSSEFIKNKFYTKGQLNLMLGWGDRDNENNLMNVKKYTDTLKKIDNFLSSYKELDFDLCGEIITKVSDTPEELETNIRNLNEWKSILDQQSVPDDSAIFCDREICYDHSRLKLLKYRESGKFHNLNNTIVPLYSSQISTEQISCLNDDESELDKYLIPDEHGLQMEPLELKRYLGAKYIKIQNLYILQNLHESMLKQTYEDVVSDNQYWNIRTIFSRLSSDQIIATTGRISNTYTHMSAVQDLRISFFRAFCLPDRIVPEISNLNQLQEGSEGFKVKQLKPFARISYKDQSKQTATAIGCNPTWHQTLNLSIGSGAPTVVNINLYDEVKEDLLDDYDSEEPHQNKVYYQLNHRWLGSLQIPLLAVQAFTKMHGTLKINTPPVILGYQSSTDTKTNNSLLHSFFDPILPMQKDAAFISLNLLVQPNLSTSTYRTLSNLYSPDVEFLFRHLTDFLNNYAKEFPSRYLSLAYFGTSGQQKCVVQFLQALPLPNLEHLQKDQRAHPRRESAMSKSSSSSQARSGDGRRSGADERVDSANTPRSSDLWTADRDAFEMRPMRREVNQLERVIHTCARYASLIPTYESSQAHEVTLMGWELLKIQHGSPLDHAILIASYFLYLGLKCWIVCGMGLPRGLSSYVLIKYDLKTERILLTTDDSGYKPRSFYPMRQDTLVPFIYDAVAGIRYDLRDPCCPLKTIHYVYNDENIWINLQPVDSCESVRLDFTRTSEWQSVFNINIGLSKLPPVPEHDLYSDPEIVDSLKQRIENKIKTKVQKWRSNRRTIWNRYCSSVLKDSLPHWEYWTFNPTTPKPGPNSRLKQLMSTYKIYGFPLNLPFTNMKRILSSIKSTAIFLSDQPSVEFGLAVEIYSYPGAVLSLWVYLASITRN